MPAPGLRRSVACVGRVGAMVRRRRAGRRAELPEDFRLHALEIVLREIPASDAALVGDDHEPEAARPQPLQARRRRRGKRRPAPGRGNIPRRPSACRRGRGTPPEKVGCGVAKLAAIPPEAAKCNQFGVRRLDATFSPRSQAELGNALGWRSCTSPGARWPFTLAPRANSAKHSFVDKCVPKRSLGTRERGKKCSFSIQVRFQVQLGNEGKSGVKPPHSKLKIEFPPPFGEP